MENKRIPLSLIDPNDGQFPNLPRNPRSWTVRELSKLKESIQETPELIEMRPPIVVEYEGRYVALGGNMRLAAIRSLCHADVECCIMPSDTPIRKLKEIVIKDNSKFGSWDYDALANNWTDYDLKDYGIPVYDYTDEPAPTDGNASPLDDRVAIDIELTPDEFSFVSAQLRSIAPTPEDAVLKILGL